MAALLNKYSYRQKLQALLWAIVPVALICYQLAFKKTNRMAEEYRKNVQMIAGSRLAADSLRLFESKMKVVSASKKQYLLDTAVMDAHILFMLNVHCRDLGVKFREYKPLSVSNQKIWTRIFTIQGSYNKLLQLIFLMEQRDKLCRIASVQLRKSKDDDGDVEATCYIQNIINDKATGLPD